MPKDNSIEEIYSEYKIVREKYDALKHDYSEGLLKKEANDEAIKKQQDTLTAILNQISGEKLAWAQEKAQGERELKEKQDNVAKILSKEQELARQEIALKAEKNAIEDKLKANNAILLEVKSQKTANEVILREAEEKIKKSENINKENIKIIEKFKEKMYNINQEIQKL